MPIKYILLLSFLTLSFCSFATAEEYIYIVMNDDDVPVIDYEGSYLKQSAGYIGKENGIFTLSLVTIDVDLAKETFILGGTNDTKDRQAINMTGTLERVGKSERCLAHESSVMMLER